MEPLLEQLRALPAKFAALPERTKTLLLLVGGGGLAAALAAFFYLNAEGRYEYAFTGLTPDDSASAVAQLKGAGIPYRVEAGGEALSVPADRVYDARILLSSVGLPKSGGVGFELFDRNEIGVSEFTQRVNLQRAIEGELARTIARFDAVRNARVHVTMPRRGLFVEDDQVATASVVLSMYPGRTLNERELAGVKHLVSSAVPGLGVEQVTVVDQSGALLGPETKTSERTQGKMERELEDRIRSILEPMAGLGSVVAKVTAKLDTTAIETQRHQVNPDATAVSSERVRKQERNARNTPRGIPAGAASNGLGTDPRTGAPIVSDDNSNTDEQDRQYDVSKTITHEKTNEPRLTKLSIAVLVRAPSEEPWPQPTLDQMSELAKKAVGYDEDRGDQFQISSAPFLLPVEEPLPEPEPEGISTTMMALVGAGVLAALVIAMVAFRGRKKPTEIDAAEANNALEDAEKRKELEAALAEPKQEEQDLRELARDLALQDPIRARLLLRAWLDDAARAMRVTEDEDVEG